MDIRGWEEVLRLAVQGKREVECASLAGRTLDPDTPTLEQDKFVSDVEAQT